MSDKGLIRSHTLDQRRRGLQESTIGNRQRMLYHLSGWMGERGLLEATTEDIETFLDARKVLRKTRYAYISSLHVFYQWAMFAGHLDIDPTARITRPKVRQGIPRPISDADLQLALSMARSEVRVIVALAAYEGMRCIEIARLTREDVLDDRQPALIVARGKGDKPRLIPLHPAVMESLWALPIPKNGPVLTWHNGDSLPPWKVSQLGNEYLHGLGIDATVHQLRHWFGTTLYRTSGKDLLLVRDMMGHSSITTTTVYAAFDRDGAAQAITALSAYGSQPPLPWPAQATIRPESLKDTT